MEERQESREVSDNKEPDLLNQHFSVVDEKMVVNLLTTAMEVTKLGAWTTRLPGSSPWLLGLSTSVSNLSFSPVRILPLYIFYIVLGKKRSPGQGVVLCGG